jgi:hypothetical protein
MAISGNFGRTIWKYRKRSRGCVVERSLDLREFVDHGVAFMLILTSVEFGES